MKAITMGQTINFSELVNLFQMVVGRLSVHAFWFADCRLPLVYVFWYILVWATPCAKV